MPFDHCRQFDEDQGVEDLRPHSVKAPPQEPIGGMKPEAARALPPQVDQLIVVAARQARVKATLGCETGTRAQRREQIEWRSCRPTRTAITQENPQAFLIVHSSE